MLKEISGAGISVVCDTDPARAEELGAYFQIPYFSDTGSMYANVDFDAVMIVTTNDTHCRIALEAAERGKHIFCEKPMARTVEECKQMINAAGEAGVKLMVGHKRRLRPTHLYMSEIIESGDVGQPVAINITAIWGQETIPGWWAKKEVSGGMLAWNGVHDLDFMRCICGDVVRVRALESRRSHENHDYPDAVFVELEFDSGAVGSFQGGFYFPLVKEHQSNEVRIICDKGGISYSGANLTVEHQSKSGEMKTRVFADFGFDEAYKRELSSFIGWLRKNEVPVLSGEDGLKCVEIMEAAYRSLETGKTVALSRIGI